MMSEKISKKRTPSSGFKKMSDVKFDRLYEQIIMKYPDGTTVVEIAKTFKIPPSTVQSALKGIHKKLYNLLKKEGVIYRKD